MIKAVIFDWGNVCTIGHISYWFSKRLACIEPVSHHNIKKVFNKFLLYEDGKISTSEFWILFKKEIKGTQKPSEYRAIYLSSYKINVKMLSLIIKLRKKYLTALCTNNNRDMFKHIKSECGLKRYFDVMLCSCDVHSQKPKLKIYRAVLNLLGVEPKECIFVDDRKCNVLAAMSIGMHAIQFSSAKPVKNLLEKIENIFEN